MSSDAMYGFATGFADGFSRTYTARMQNEAETKRDKIRLGAQSWLKQEERYNSAKNRDEAFMSQAKALTESETLIPNDATNDVFNMLKSGRTVSMIIADVRKAGSAFNAIPPPPESIGEVGIQTDAMLETPSLEADVGADASVSPSAAATMTVPDSTPVDDTSTASKEEDPNNPFNQYKAEIQDSVGQTEGGGYFDQVVSGYQPNAKANKYNFVPGVSKTDVKSIDEALAENLYGSADFLAADNVGQQKMMLELVWNKKGDGTSASTSIFGTGSVGAAMTVWSLSPEGKAAIASNDGTQIAKQIKVFTDIISPTAASESGKPKKDFDVADLEGSFMNIWENSEAGIAAEAAGDNNAYAEAVAAASEQAEVVRNSLNIGYGFDPSTITELKQLPGARVTYKDYPVVLQQLSVIEEGLEGVQADSISANSTSKLMSVYAQVDGKLAFVGTGTFKGGKLYMPNPASEEGELVEVPPSDAARMVMSSSDNPIDAEKWAANDTMQKRDTLFGTVDFASSALTYLSSLEENPQARTWVARTASGVREFLTELDTIKSLSTIVNPDGEEVIDRDRFLDQLKTNDQFSKYSAGVRAVMAQEASLIFDVARAEGNSGTALSNKDYDNYFKSIFSSNEPAVIKANLERKVGQSMKAAIAGAQSIANSPGMQYAMSGTGGTWWSTPKETVLKNRTQPEINFVEASLASVNAVQEASSYGSTPEQKLAAYMRGEEIEVDQAMVDAYGVLEGDLGQKIHRKMTKEVK